MRARHFLSLKLLLSPTLLAAALTMLGTGAAANTYSVEPGDTLSRIAVNNTPPAVRLDQMLVAPFRTNEPAFKDRNMNRLKAGEILTIPGPDEAAKVPPAEATKTVRNQAADWRDYQDRVARSATEAEGPGRRAASQETSSWSRPGGAADASSWTTVPIVLAAREGEDTRKEQKADPVKTTDAAGTVVGKDNTGKPWWREKEVWAALGGIVALLGTAVPLMTKGFESVSLASRRRKELQHIEDLAELMEKVKKENVLSKSTQDNVCMQVEEEIKTAVDQLGINRASREKALAARQKALERKKEQARSGPPLWRRIFLLYWPRGIGAWIAHGFAFLYAFVAITAVFPPADWELFGGSVFILLVSWFFAWFGRKRWQKAQNIEKRVESFVDPGPVGAAVGS